MKERILLKRAATALLLAATMTAGFTACSVMDDNPVTPEVPDTYPIAIDEKHFPDAAFRTYLKEYCWEWATDGVLTEEEANGVKALYVTNKEAQGIKSVKGIEWFGKLETLEVSGQEITEIDVSQNTELYMLELMSNQLAAIDVTKNKKLELLDLTHNRLTAIDLSENTALEQVWLSDNQLTSLNLTGLPAIKIVSCSSNQIKGTAMDAFIASLPTVDLGGIFGIDVSNPNEGNIITKSQVAAADAKGWLIMDPSTRDEYPGSDE